MRKVNCYIPIKLRIIGEMSDEEFTLLGETLERAITARIAFAQRTIDARSASSQFPAPRSTHKLFRLADYTTNEANTSTRNVHSNISPLVPVQYKTKTPNVPQVHKPSSRTTTAPTWTKAQLLQHIYSNFGTYGPVGQTHYGVQVGNSLFIVTEMVDGVPKLISWLFQRMKKDVKGHLQTTGEYTSYAQGRYVFQVEEKTTQEEDTSIAPYIGYTSDLQGTRIGGKSYVPAEYSPGFRVAFDVPALPDTASDATGTQTGSGILPGRTGLVPLQCHPRWDPTPLVDPAYKNMSDEDLFHLFLNLCNARAIDNLDLSEKYIHNEIAPLYTGPGGATTTLSNYSRHNIEHFKEDLRLLRGLMVALNTLSTQIDQINKDLDPFVMTHHRAPFRTPFTIVPPLGEEYWPTYHTPDIRDVEKVNQLLNDLKVKTEAFQKVMRGILALVQESPLLTQFIKGLELRDNTADVPDKGSIEAELADVQDDASVQKKILETLDDILQSLAKARHKLCIDPERILDVPLVYQQVQQMLHGVHPRFDQVVQERIAHHQRQEAWIDIGIGAAGLVLFVGGLIVSLAGGPAGVAAFLSLAGTVLSIGTAARSLSKADFLSSLANASLVQGHGLVTLEAAYEAEDTAALDSIFAAVDVGLGAFKIIQSARGVLAARETEAAVQLERSAKQFTESVEVGQKIPFSELLNKAAPRGQLPLNEAELAQLQSLGKGGQSTAISGRIAEEVAGRTIIQSGDYVQLATKVKANQGIDLVFVRRSIFEKIFGKVADVEARTVLGRATDEQLNALVKALRESKDAEDMISIEVKFTRVGDTIEGLLSASRGGVQQNTQWFKGLLPDMLKAKDPEVRQTGELLARVIGNDAEKLEQLTRIGIAMDVRGNFTFTKLNDEIIGKAYRSKVLYRSWRLLGGEAGYQKTVSQLIQAHRAGDEARVASLRAKLIGLNRQIDALDKEVRLAKEGLNSAQRAQASLQRATTALGEIDQLLTRPQTPVVLDALHVATATARLHLAVAHQSIEETDAAYQHINQHIDDANKHLAQYATDTEAALDEWDKIEPGVKEHFRREIEKSQSEHRDEPIP